MRTLTLSTRASPAVHIGPFIPTPRLQLPLNVVTARPIHGADAAPRLPLHRGADGEPLPIPTVRGRRCAGERW